jgi:hypothetical protein
LERLHELKTDATQLRLYEEGCFSTVTVGELAAKAIARMQA